MAPGEVVSTTSAAEPSGVEPPSLPGYSACIRQHDVSCQRAEDMLPRSAGNGSFEQELRSRLTQIERKLDGLAGKLISRGATAKEAAEAAPSASSSGIGLAEASQAGPRQPSKAEELEGDSSSTAELSTLSGGTKLAEVAPSEKAMAKARTVAWQEAPPPPAEEPKWVSSSISMKTHEWVGRSSTHVDLPLGFAFGLDETIEKLEQTVSKAQVTARERPSFRVARGRYFEALSCAAIILNALYIGYSADATIDSAMHHRSASKAIFVGNCIFTTFFLVELLFRAWAERLLFICSEEWKWNLFDLIIVTLGVMDMLMESMAPSGMDSVTVARLLRLARFVKLMRMTRVMKHALSLRLVVNTILASFMSLFWCFVVVAFVIYIFAVLFVYAAAESIMHQGRDRDRAMLMWYGDVSTAMTSLFMAISGGADWKELMDPLRAIDESYGPIFIFYIFFMFFGVLNVVVGAFVATTSDVAQKDRDALVKGEMARLEGYTARIKTFFSEADIDKSGTLSWSEFCEHLQHTRVKAYFQALELDVSQAHSLFELLDTDGSDSVTIDEFLDGCLRLKGSAKNLDLHMLSHQCTKFMKDLKSLKAQLLRSHGLLQKHLGIMAAATPSASETHGAATAAAAAVAAAPA